MIKILSTEQIRALDAYTIAHVPIASIDLMERACKAFVDWFKERFPLSRRVLIFCGPGNNGGDGLGIARLLWKLDYAVAVRTLPGKGSADYLANRKRLPKGVDIQEIKPGDVTDSLFDDWDILVDALYGSGLSRPLEGLSLEVARAMNNARAVRVAVDIPSGLMDGQPAPEVALKADFTVAFQLPKISFFLPQHYAFTGEWHTVDIGLSPTGIEEASTPYQWVEGSDIAAILKTRKRFGHKGTYGHALLVAGSFGKMGASVLAARAALRAGVGLLTAHVPASGYTIIQTAVPEAMAEVDLDEQRFTTVPERLEGYQAVGMGPGLGTDKKSQEALLKTLETLGRPVVLDADALNLLSQSREGFHILPQGSILTPHPGEFRRMVGEWGNDLERLEKQKDFAVKHHVHLILKGAFTSIATPEGQVYFNPTGNPGMGTGGSGDVLTGILTGLLAQGYAPLEASLAGVYLHALAGDLVAKDKGMDSLIASDLVDYLPAAFLQTASERRD